MDSLADHYVTAGEAFPLSIPLEKADMGAVTFSSNSTSELNDLQLLYELSTTDILIRNALPGFGQPGIYRIKGVQAANLDLINLIPGYLEGIMARLTLETNQNIVFEPDPLFAKEDSNKSISSSREFSSNRVTLMASVHECGHLRDVLLFLKSENLDNFPLDSLNPYYNSNKNQRDKKKYEAKNEPPLTYLETLPWWCLHIPYWIYSRKIRKLAQTFLLLYSLFSIIWASWQLYRHVNVIQVALEPFVHIFRVYLEEIMEYLDDVLAGFTYYWTCLLSPLNIIRGLLMMPIFNALIQLKDIFMPLVAPIIKVLSPFSKCFAIVWRTLQSSRVAVQSLDITRIRQNMVINLLIGSLKAFALGLANLVGYSKAKSKQMKAVKAQTAMKGSITSPGISLTPEQRKKRNSNRKDTMPVYYSSPLTKHNS